ncbi:growth factor receptor-bound protein 14 isoform X3 [Hemicordylus capensis]|uniref:growth factor receptor-bound protein 14 isoform X3 n=1 Tax=Hemicordylus capensis TaxID=884348 RepID=UPI002303AF8B|nr:growth factor receptor-bound protein 14 isoform X3 [Hemicordylus capensis]
MAAPLPGLQSSAGRRVAAERRALAQRRGGASSMGEMIAFSSWMSPRAPLVSVPLREERRLKMELGMLEVPIPNPFPELCCSQFTSVLSASLLPKVNPRIKQVIKVYSEDETRRTLEVPSDITARDLCQLLILKNHYVDDHSWTLFEHLGCLGLERIIEDHEMVIEVQSKWGIEEDNRLYFRKNYAKYEFFKNPVNFFPGHLVSFSNEINGALSHTQILQEPRHLQLFSEFSSSDIYMSLMGKKISGVPVTYGFCFKPNRAGGARDVKRLYADSEQSRTCWVTAIRLLKYGMQLYQNYMQPSQGRGDFSSLITPVRSISENSLVAMDFTGHKSRVIENPTEALSVAVEEGLAWRKKGCLRLGTHGSPNTLQNVPSNIAIHSSQPWFHHKISREEAHQLILRQGLVDGVFLVRDSQSNPKSFVLSLSDGLKIKHFQIVPLEEEAKLFYTLDDGHTRFSDLIQLVEFYQLNKGILPCKLKHYCARIAL